MCVCTIIVVLFHHFYVLIRFCYRLSSPFQMQGTIFFYKAMIFLFFSLFLLVLLPACLPFATFVDSWIFIHRKSAKCEFHMNAFCSKLIKFVSDIQSPFWNQEQWELNNYNFISHFAYTNCSTKIYLAFIRKRSIRLNWIFAWINSTILWIFTHCLWCYKMLLSHQIYIK